MQEALVKLSSLGDIIHLALLLPMFENRERMWFVDSEFAPLLENSPFISAIYPLPLRHLLRTRASAKLVQILWQLRNIGTFDYAIDAQGLFKSALIGALLRTKSRYGFSRKSAREGIAALFYNHRYHIAYSEHILKRNAQLLAFAYGQACDEARLAEFLATRASRPLPLAPSAEGARKIAALLQPFGAKPKILFALESSRASKVYPPQHFLALSKLLPECQIFLLSHSAPEVATQLVAQNNALCALPRLNLDELKALILQTDLVIGGDTGVVHLAFALCRASLMLFSDTTIERFGLLSPQNRALHAPSGLQDLAPESVAQCAHAILETR